jgi:hypothetical protein
MQEVMGAPQPDAAKTWPDFIHSSEALQIFAHYGFNIWPYSAVPMKGYSQLQRTRSRCWAYWLCHSRGEQVTHQQWR